MNSESKAEGETWRYDTQRLGPGYITNGTVSLATWGEAARYLNQQSQRLEQAVEALRALAKVQYDGTVYGLRHQIETEDWGDVLDVDETRAAYELTLAALTPPAEQPGGTR